VALETAPRVFKKAVSEYGGRVALRKKEYGLWHDISWNSYYREVSYVGSALIFMGLERGDCVSIIGDNCPEWIMIDMGIRCAGGVAVGVYATSAWPQVEYVVEHSESKFFFVENEEQLDKWLMFKDKAPKLEKVIVWDTEGLRHFKDPQVMTYDKFREAGRKVMEENPELIENRMDDVELDDISMLVYTSGTTGPPKGAMLTHRNLSWISQNLFLDYEVFDTDEVLSFLPLCHVFERLFSVIAHIEHGYIVSFVEKPDTVAENMIEISPTVGYAVPRIWEKYCSAIQIRMTDASWFKRLVFCNALKIGEKRADLTMNFKKVPLYVEILFQLASFAVFRKLKKRMGFDRFRAAFSGAAPISPDLLRFYHAIGVNMYEGYGQTEGSAVTTASRPDCVKFGCVGQPLHGVEIKIADDGEILVKSPGVFKGYLKNPEGTAEAIKDGWLHSGDVGEIDDDGFLKITGRKKDLIVTAGGKNIAPQSLESKLKSCLYINDAVVIGDRRKYLTCLIMIDEDNVAQYAQNNKIQFSTYRDLAQNLEIIRLIQGEVNKVNETVSRAENIRKFTLLPKKLYEEDGEVTPTMKIKRKYVNEAFSDLIEAMYSEVR
jgi:long-chain acyl-CoA synthetase